jgi:hypothetical protein
MMVDFVDDARVWRPRISLRRWRNLGWMVVVAFAIAVVGTLVLARFGEAPSPEPS